MSQSPFGFVDFSPPSDGDLEVVLAERQPAESSIWKVPAYIFRMVDRVSRQPMGRVSLRIGLTENCTHYAGQVGFRVEPEFRGHHYAERAVRLILPLARRHGLTELWITAAPDNRPSRRTLERLGAIHVQTLAVPPDYPGDGKTKCRYRLALE